MKTTITEPLPVENLLIKTMQDILKNWWLLLIAGLLLAGLGAWIIRSPFQSYLTLSWLFAVGMIGTGLADILFAWTNRHSKRWIWWFLAGIADLVIGTYLFNNKLITIVLLPLIVGLWTFYKGFMAVGDALHIRAYNFGNWRRLLFTAVLVVLMASLLLLCPVVGIENIFFFSGLAFLAAGLFRIYLALKLRQIGLKHGRTA
ncbi:HdeD family acid-resistance protein [Mucilaginibacter sp. UR6-11]|uniref:HdeD family acid-resistance protein n=1 Tax=Mucilaginibacter sp. UR6-11 TaxID=1435644 RepID=UPI001E2DA870|nr:DUF308 domain-containing protein [Mucilaginibacter sp. UR6-11]MCC8425487.1 DUF308 domain-containing protein [Mucilaginibacter sp. UR6-11]